MPLPPAASVALFTSSASLLICILHGVTMLHVDAIPICGFLKSSSPNPTARSIARLGACSTPSTTSFEYLRLSLSVMGDYLNYVDLFGLLIAFASLARGGRGVRGEAVRGVTQRCSI